MKPLEDRLMAANTLLASYAIPNEGLKGRAHEDPKDETRFTFQRDRDRIIHTQAFRRLKGKTQVFVEGHGDHVRTRLTHTMEVAQISRDIARTFGLNEDLTECIALAHDLGHPPFGHAGEATLDAWMQQFGLRFEHNEQSHRIATLLEDHSSLYQGLNLNQEVLESLLKHSSPHDAPEGGESLPVSLEAQVVNIADEIAYTGHDCEDGRNAKLFSIDELLTVSLARCSYERAQPRNTSLRGAIIHMLVHDLYQATETALMSQRINTVDDVYNETAPIVQFSHSVRTELDELRTFLSDHMYFHPQVLEKSGHGQKVVRALCDRYQTSPPDKVLELQQKTNGALEEAIKDYVAGMTDTYAMEQYQK